VACKQHVSAGNICFQCTDIHQMGIYFTWLYTKLRQKTSAYITTVNYNRQFKKKKKLCPLFSSTKQNPPPISQTLFMILNNSVLLDKLTATQSRTSSLFIEPQGSLPWSQDPAYGLYPEPNESRPQLSNIFL